MSSPTRADSHTGFGGTTRTVDVIRVPAWSAPGVEADSGDMTGWFPLRVLRRAEGLRLVWGDLSGVDLSSESFFSRVRSQHDHAVRHGLRRPARETGLEALTRVTRSSRPVAPTALVFHTSHSGSTLLTNMLAASPSTLAVSEPRPIQEAFRLLDAGHLEAAERQELLEALPHLLTAWGHTHDPAVAHHVIKFNSYHLRHYRLLRSLLPEARVVCVYRGPDEILAGRLRRFPHSNHIWNLEGHVDPVRELALQQTGVVALMVETLAQFYDHIRTVVVPDPDALAIDYADFDEAGYRRVFDHLGVADSDEHVAAMLARTRFHSKEWQAQSTGSPTEGPDGHESGTEFSRDTERRRRKLTPELTELIERRARPAYDALTAAGSATAPAATVGGQPAPLAGEADAAGSDDSPGAAGVVVHGAPERVELDLAALIGWFPDRVEPLDDGPALVLHDPADGPPRPRPDGHLLVAHDRAEVLLPWPEVPAVLDALEPITPPPDAVIVDRTPGLGATLGLSATTEIGAAVQALQQSVNFLSPEDLRRFGRWALGAAGAATERPATEKPPRPMVTVVDGGDASTLQLVLDVLPATPVAVLVAPPLVHLGHAYRRFAADPGSRRIESVLNEVPSEQRLVISPLEAHALQYGTMVAAVAELVLADRVVVLDRVLLSGESVDRWDRLGPVPDIGAEAPDALADLSAPARESILTLVENHALGPYDRLRAACRSGTKPAITVLEI